MMFGGNYGMGTGGGVFGLGFITWLIILIDLILLGLWLWKQIKK